MRTTIISKLLLFAAVLPAFAADPARPNTLTDAEKAAGWRLLWDGKTTDGWRSPKTDGFPKKGWSIKDGVLTVLDLKGVVCGGGGDIFS